MAENLDFECDQDHDNKYAFEFSDSNENKKESVPDTFRSTSFKSKREFTSPFTATTSTTTTASSSLSESVTTGGGGKNYRFPQRNRVLSNESHTFLDRFRTQSSSKSLNYSPSRKSSSCSSYSTTTKGTGRRSSSVNINRNNNNSTSNSSSTEFGSNSTATTKPRKWYSFNSLLSSPHLANILSYPRSRLSVSSTLNSVFIGNSSSSPVETPTPSEDTYQNGSFFNGAFNFYPNQQTTTTQEEESQRVTVPSSPTPSCVTISGEFPSRSFLENNPRNTEGSFFLRRGRTIGGGGGAGGRVQRKIKTNSFSSEKNLKWNESERNWREIQDNIGDDDDNDDCNNENDNRKFDIFNNSRASISPFQDNSNNSSSISGFSSVHRPSSSSSGCTNKRLSRLSCGEFYPNSSSSLRNSSVFTDSDTESLNKQSPETLFNNSYHHHHHQQPQQPPQASINNKSTSIRNRKTLGRSLPTLLQAMESTNNGQAGLNNGSSKVVTTQDVFDLLYQEFIILTGAKSIDDHYIMIFPDRGNFHLLEDSDYRRLMIYLTSIPSMQESESGFVIVIDRRQDKWNSVKQTLMRISVFFPGVIHRVFVLRPVGFLQKALSEVSSKFQNLQNLRFNLTVCNSLSDLYICIHSNQLTKDFGGSIHYDKVKWVQQRIEVEAFGEALKVLSTNLKSFTLSFHDLEYPNDVEETERLLQDKTVECHRLMEELNLASEHGENLLQRIKRSGQTIENNGNNSNMVSSKTQSSTNDSNSVQLINVISVERYILQIEDTSRLFQDFWDKEKSELEQCLKLRRFEHDFKELQGMFDTNVKKLNAIPDMGNNVQETLDIIEETRCFQQLSMHDVNRAIELEMEGRLILSNSQSSLAVDTVEPKCIELKRMATHFRFIIEEKLQVLQEWSEVQSTISLANKLCTEGMDLLASQQTMENIEDCVDSGVVVKKIDTFLEVVQNISDELMKSMNSISSTSQSTKLLKQVHKRVDDLQAVMRSRRSSVLQTINKNKLRRSSGSSSTTATTSLSSNGMSRLSVDLKTNNSKSTSQLEGTGKADLPVIGETSSVLKQTSSTLSLDGSIQGGSFMSGGKLSEETLESRRIKRGHVLKELLQTENSYVNEIGDVLNGYREGVQDPAMRSLLPKQLQQPPNYGNEAMHEQKSSNMNVLFGNLDEIHSFHSKCFLPDLTNCIKSVELVGLCFIQRHVEFLTLYSRYCQFMPASEMLRNSIGENHAWFVACRKKLNHQLPLGAYLLKPVQRITKYQLLLKDLLKNSEGCDGYQVLLDALDHMLVVLRCVNDGMLQLSIQNYPGQLHDEGPLLLQGSFMLWTETKKDRLRLKGHQRHLFLYQKSILICKKDKDPKSTSLYFKTKINLSEIGLTEALKGSGSSKKFEIWVQGRLKVFILQAETVESKENWVQSIKKLLMEQLETLRITKSSGVSTNVSVSMKRHKMMNQHKGLSMNGWKSSGNTSAHRVLRQTSSWVASDSRPKSRTSNPGDVEEDGSSSNSDDDESYSLNLPNNDQPSSLPLNPPIYNQLNAKSNCLYGSGENVENGPKYIALAEFRAGGSAEISFKQGSSVQEGWVPSAFFERLEASSTGSSSNFDSHAMQRNANQSSESLTSILR